MNPDPILVTGATGYVGTELVAELLVSGRGLAEALDGCRTAYYLIHSMDADGDFAARMWTRLTRLPVMVCPRWIDTRTQPIAVQDVVRALAEVAEADAPPARGAARRRRRADVP